MKAVITGASRGIGKAIATKLAESGYDLAICSRNQDDINLIAAELEHLGVKVYAYALDCGDKQQSEQFFKAVSQDLGVPDVLVNNVGVFLPGNILDETDEQFEIQQKTNVNSAYYCAKFFGREMRDRQSGHIFNICSVASKQAIENAGSYCVTKAAMLSLNNVLRKELSKYHVKVTAILPGSTLTSSWEGTQMSSEKFVQPEDVAEALIAALKMSAGANIDEITIKPLQF